MRYQKFTSKTHHEHKFFALSLTPSLSLSRSQSIFIKFFIWFANRTQFIHRLKIGYWTKFSGSVYVYLLTFTQYKCNSYSSSYFIREISFKVKIFAGNNIERIHLNGKRLLFPPWTAELIKFVDQKITICNEIPRLAQIFWRSHHNWNLGHRFFVRYRHFIGIRLKQMHCNSFQVIFHENKPLFNPKYVSVMALLFGFRSLDKTRKKKTFDYLIEMEKHRKFINVDWFLVYV